MLPTATGLKKTMRTIAEINDKIQSGSVVVMTIEELKAKVAEVGVAQTAQAVDVVVAGTFEPMEASGAIINSWPYRPAH
jgi:L-aspartate semialdehyde sulfurtransferase